MSSSSSSSSSSHNITLLGAVQDYADITEQANNDLKTSLWHLTKSRRKVGGGILDVDSSTNFTVELLREDIIRATSRVQRHVGDEQTVTDQSEPEEGEAKDCCGDETKRTIQQSSWTLVREEDEMDPINLFYGHNRQLKVAQRNAQNALNGYIEAANQAAELLTLIREHHRGGDG